ncbi:TPA: hypothetical protein ACX6SY_000741 [Photobacterium damselae]
MKPINKSIMGKNIPLYGKKHLPKLVVITYLQLIIYQPKGGIKNATDFLGDAAKAPQYCDEYQRAFGRKKVI